MKSRAATPDQLAAILKGRRRTMGLTQQQAGSRVGLLQKTISSFETDPSGRSIASLYKLLAALELELVLEPRTGRRTDDSGSEW